MASTEPFIPKQAMPKTAALYTEVVGETTVDVARHTIAHFLPPFTSDAIIHDNACGTGAVTTAIMESNPPKGVTIKATDVNQYMILNVATKTKWPVAEATVMAAQSLTFPDNHFTHSFSNFFTQQMDLEKLAPTAKGLYRTLKPGGSAIVSSWAGNPYVEPMERANLETRGKDFVWPLSTRPGGYEKQRLKEFYVDGGFKEENIRIETCDVYLTTKDLRRLMNATWSLAGPRKDGWYPEDEENWDRVIDICVGDIEAGEYYEKRSDGTVALRFPVWVGIAVK